MANYTATESRVAVIPNNSVLESEAQQIFRETLFRKFNEIKERNGSYSLRAFAKRLSMAPGALSEIFNAKRKVSRNLALEILDKVPVSVDEREAVNLKMMEEIRLAELDNYRPKTRAEVLSKMGEKKHDLDYMIVLGYLSTDGDHSDLNVLSDRTGIPIVKAEQILNDFKSWDIVSRSKYSIFTEFAPEAQIHDQDSSPENMLHQSSIAIPSNLEKLPQVKSLVMNFQRRMAEYMRQGNCSDVCVMNIDLTKVTK